MKGHIILAPGAPHVDPEDLVVELDNPDELGQFLGQLRSFGILVAEASGSRTWLPPQMIAGFQYEESRIIRPR